MTETNQKTAEAPAVSRRKMLTGTALAGGAGLALGAAGAAGVAWADTGATGESGSGPVIDVVLDDKKPSVPAEIPSGLVTFRVSTESPQGRSMLLVQLNDGVTVDGYLKKLAATGTRDPEERAEAAQAVAAAVTNLGGAVVVKGISASCTQVLAPGEYVLVNYAYAGGGGPPLVRKVRATRPDSAPYPGTDGFIVHRETADGPVYSISGDKLPARGAVSVVNTTETPQEAMIAKVREGTTAKDIKEYFGSFAGGEAPTPPPILSRPVGMAPLGANQWGLLHTRFEPGPHVVFSFTISHETGVQHAVEGMFQLVELT